MGKDDEVLPEDESEGGENEEVEGKGEEGKDKGGEGKPDLAAAITIGEVEVAEEDDGEKDKEKPEKKVAKKPEKPDDTWTPREKELLQKNKDLNIALHNERQAKKKGDGKDEEVVLTDTQIVGLLEEYKDDPKTMNQIIKYQAQQAAKSAARETVDAADMAKKKKEADDYLLRTYPDLAVPDSELRTAVDKTKAGLGLENHPYGDLFGAAVTFFLAAPTALKNAYDKGIADAKAGVSKGEEEKARKELVKGSGLPMKGKKGTGTTEKMLSENDREVAKKLGITSPRQIAIFNKLRSTSKRDVRTLSVEE